MGILKLAALRVQILLVASGLIAGCPYSDKSPAVTASGKQLYEEYCASCHKTSGLGRFLLGVPATFSDNLSREEVIKLIREGDPRYPRMPVFPQLRFSQADKIALYLRQLEAQQ